MTTTTDGTGTYRKDRAPGQPAVLSHGRPGRARAGRPGHRRHAPR
jgi:hypothetical protein